MKRVIYNKVGGPEVLEIQEAPIPTIKKNEVLVRMLATSVNGGDLGLRRGDSKLVAKLTKYPQVMGIDVVGVVDHIGANVTDFKVGDKVWGNCGPNKGTTAEYFAVPASKIALLPDGLDPIKAAAIPTAGITALTALLKNGKLKKGEKVLIRGVGGVGLTGVQISKAHGAHVTALCSGATTDGVKANGADDVFDYHKTKLDELGQFDVIFDTVGTDLGALRKHLTKNGRLVTIAVASFMGDIMSVFYGKRRTRLALGFSNHEILNYLAKMVNKREIVPVIDSVYPMEQIAEAHRRAEERGLLGKIVISIADNNLLIKSTEKTSD